VTHRTVSEDEDIVDLRAMSTVGGVMYLDLLKLPPQAKKVGNWVIQDSKSGNDIFILKFIPLVYFDIFIGMVS
jgi:hypothetical protein